MSFSSMPGGSAETRTSWSDAVTSRLGQDPPDQAGMRPNADGRPLSKRLNTSSKSRFISRCKVRNGLASSPCCIGLGTEVRLRPQGIKSLTAIVSSFRYSRAAPCPRAFARGVGDVTWLRLGRFALLRLVLDLLGGVLPDGLRPADAISIRRGFRASGTSRC